MTDIVVLLFQIIYEGIYSILCSRSILKLIGLVFNEITNNILTATTLPTRKAKANVYLSWHGRKCTRYYLFTIVKKKSGRASTAHPPTIEGDIRVRNGCEDAACIKESAIHLQRVSKWVDNLYSTWPISLYLITRHVLFWWCTTKDMK